MVLPPFRSAGKVAPPDRQTAPAQVPGLGLHAGTTDVTELQASVELVVSCEAFTVAWFETGSSVTVRLLQVAVGGVWSFTVTVLEQVRTLPLLSVTV